MSVSQIPQSYQMIFNAQQNQFEDQFQFPISKLPFTESKPKKGKKKITMEQIKLKYKTELCKNYEMNNKSCKFGENCAYAHGRENLRKPSMNIIENLKETLNIQNTQPKNENQNYNFVNNNINSNNNLYFSNAPQQSKQPINGNVSYIYLLELIKNYSKHNYQVKRLPVFVDITMV